MLTAMLRIRSFRRWAHAAVQESKHPVSDQEFARTMARLRVSRNERIGIAFSGSFESVALAHLIRRFVRRKDDLKCFIVNHNLTPEQAQEAHQAAEMLQSLELDYELIDALPLHEYPGLRELAVSKQNAIARLERFNLITRAAARDARSFRRLATAHSRNDSLEVMLNRLMFGSREAGLVGIAETMPSAVTHRLSKSILASLEKSIPRSDWSIWQNALRFGPEASAISIVRPLLNYSRERLLDTCHAHGLPFMNEPANHISIHQEERNELRSVISFDHVENAAANYLEHARMQQQQLDREAQAVLQRYCLANPISGSFRFSPLGPKPSDASTPWIYDLRLAKRVLSHMVRWSSGLSTFPVKPNVLERVVIQIQNNINSTQPLSIARVIVSGPRHEEDSKSTDWHINREPFKTNKPAPTTALTPIVTKRRRSETAAMLFQNRNEPPPCDSQLWDDRWWLRLAITPTAKDHASSFSFHARPFNVDDLNQLRTFALKHRLPWMRHHMEHFVPNELGLTPDSWHHFRKYLMLVPVKSRYTIPVVTARAQDDKERLVAFPTLGLQFWRDRGVICEAVYAEPIPGRTPLAWGWNTE